MLAWFAAFADTHYAVVVSIKPLFERKITSNEFLSFIMFYLCFLLYIVL